MGRPAQRVDTPLARWLERAGLTRSDFARLIGCSPMTVSRWCLPYGDPDARIPQDRETIHAIYRATNGEITPNDWYDLPKGEAA